MKTTLIKISSLCLISGSIILGACSSSDSTPASAIPLNAIRIDATNAEDTVAAAVGTGTALLNFAFGAEAVAMPTAMDFLNLIRDKMDNKNGGTVLDSPTGIVEVIPCDVSGTYTDNYTETATSIAGTLTFNDCIDFNSVLGSTFTINGSASYNGAFTVNEDYTANFSGNATFEVSGIVVTISGLSANISGNDISGDYSVNSFSYTLDTNLDDGFAVRLESALTGNDFTFPDCPTSGAVLALGSESTRARGQFNNDFTVTTSFDDGSGTFVDVSTLSCSNYI